MSTQYLAETTVSMIMSYLETNLPTCLAHVRASDFTNRFLDSVTTEPPRSYFVYPRIKGYTLPAVMVIIDQFDFRPGEKKANHVNAAARCGISCFLEDRDEERLTIKAYRYLDAFYECLAQQEIVSTTDNVKLIVVINRAMFTPHYTVAGQDPMGIFRKELQLECSVEHYSNF